MDTRTPRQLHSRPSMRGGGASSLEFVARPRRRARRLAMLGALAAMAALGLRTAAEPPTDSPGTAVDLRALGARDGGAGRHADGAPDADGVATEGATGDVSPPAVEVQPLAAVGDVVAHLPSTDVLLVGYHEASRPGVLELQPIGVGASNENTTRITLPPDDEDGPDYHVMSSRGRVHPPTSAVDIVMRDDDPVLAPLDGVVTEVRPYELYGQHADTRIEIQPAAAPDLRLVMIHVDDVRVAVGDRVTTGVTELAGTANRFPFASHVDRYLDERWPHVHMELKDPAEAATAS